MGRLMDSSLAQVLDNRGLASKWVLPAALQRAFERNRAYATDPYQLGVEPLRQLSFVTGSKFGEPLSTQLRTMIALESDARFVLIPLELRFESEGTRMRGVMRLVFLDPRVAEAKWVGEVKGVPADNAALALAVVANLVADLFVAP